MSTKTKHRLIDVACTAVIIIVIVAAVTAAIHQCGRVAKRELASSYRYVGDVIW